MQLVTLTTAIAQVQKLANVENATAFISTADITTLLNEAWTRVYREICRSAQDYYLTSQQWTLIPGQDTYYTTAGAGPAGTNILNTDIWDVRGFNQQFSGGEFPIWRNCYSFEYEERNSRPVATGTSWPNPTYQYSFRGAGPTLQRITLIPIPSTADIVRLDYYPNAQVLVSGSDTWDGQNGWDHLAIAIAARWCAIKDENYELIPHLDADIQQWTAQIKGEVTSRNMGEAPRVRRRRYRLRGRYNPWGYGNDWWM